MLQLGVSFASNSHSKVNNRSWISAPTWKLHRFRSAQSEQNEERTNPDMVLHSECGAFRTISFGCPRHLTKHLPRSNEMHNLVS